MEQINKRKHPRISYEGKVDLVFSDRKKEGYLARNLCLSGVWVLGCEDCTEGEACDIYFYNAGMAGGRALVLKGQVSRVDDGGIAIALVFKDMNFRTYTNLQTMIENYSESTFEDADDFLNEVAGESFD